MRKIFSDLSKREKWFLVATLFCLALTVVTTSAWHYRLKPMATVWGDVATWAAVCVAGFGLLFTGVSLRGQTTQRREEQQRLMTDESESRKANARSVAVRSQWITNSELDPYSETFAELSMYSSWTLMNASPYPVTETQLTICSGIDGDVRREYWVGTVLPGQTLQNDTPAIAPGPLPFTGLRDSASLRFTDAWGQIWIHDNGALTAISAVSEVSEPGPEGPKRSK